MKASAALLPEDAYVSPLLLTLEERGGTAPAREIIEEVGHRLEGKLTQRDNEVIASGQLRWRNRVQFARLRLVEEGLISRDSPRGVWSLTNEGRRRAKQAKDNQTVEETEAEKHDGVT